MAAGGGSGVSAAIPVAAVLRHTRGTRPAEPRPYNEDGMKTKTNQSARILAGALLAASVSSAGALVLRPDGVSVQ